MRKYLLVIMLGLLCITINANAENTPVGNSNAEVIRLGEQMYREGILPSGKPMTAIVSGDVPMEGTFFTCVSCHLRSGLGSLEGNIATPPTNGRILYEPRKPFIKGFAFVPSYHSYSADFSVRSAYNDESLAALITSGVDPDGRVMNRVMPRYDIDDKDMAILITYLRTLSNEPSPGVSKSEIKFATVIVEGTSKAAIDSMLAPIEFGFGRKNSLATASAANRRVARKAYNKLGPDLLQKRFTLSKWILKGPTSTWRAQLDDYYQAEPVFALLGGISAGDWQPVHQFCEDNNIPDLLPIVDYPVLSEKEWYTLYFSHGIRQEGEAAAQYLQGMQDLFAGREIVQIIRDSRRGQALATGFRETWLNAGHKAPVDITVKEDELLSKEFLEEINRKEKPVVLLVWDDASSLAAIDGLVAKKEHPAFIVTSGTYWDAEMLNLPARLRKNVYFTYPYRLPHEDARFDNNVRRVLVGKPYSSLDQKIIRKSYIINDLIGKAFTKMRSEYYRDFLLDTIGMMIDDYYPLYERVGFGPGQRYISKGCFIVQVGKGENPRLERRSEWVTR